MAQVYLTRNDRSACPFNGIEGMPQDEAIVLLDELKHHATQTKYQLRLKYGMGDVVIWDNPSLLHAATLTQ